MILLVSFYVDPDSRRQAELLECLRRNSRNDLISEIHVFVEDPRGAGLAAIFTELADARIRLIAHERRATYSDLFTYANRHLAGWRVIIANADIYFDRSLARLDGYDLADRLLCLSRWDVQANGETHLFDFSASQDAWIFQAPLREFRADFHLGVLGCDNRLAWEAEHVGLTLSNPSRTIRANHLHLSEVRRYARQWLRGPTRAVTPEVLDNRWLWFVMPVLDGLGPMHQTLASLQSQPRSTCVLVDASGSDAVTEWAGEHAPNAVVVHVDSGSHPSVAELWNRGAAAADAVGVVGFLDATVTARDSLSQYVLEHVEPGIFLHRHGAPISDRRCDPPDWPSGGCPPRCCHLGTIHVPRLPPRRATAAPNLRFGLMWTSVSCPVRFCARSIPRLADKHRPHWCRLLLLSFARPWAMPSSACGRVFRRIQTSRGRSSRFRKPSMVCRSHRSSPTASRRSRSSSCPRAGYMYSSGTIGMARPWPGRGCAIAVYGRTCRHCGPNPGQASRFGRSSAKLAIGSSCQRK